MKSPKSMIFLSVVFFICFYSIGIQNSFGMTKSDKIEEKKTEDYYKLGNQYMDQGNYIKALPYFLSFLEVTENKTDKQTLNKKAEVLFKIASIHYYFNDYSSSVKYNQDAIDYATKTGNEEIKIKAICNIFAPLAELGRYDEALKANEKYYQSRAYPLTPFAYTVNKAYIALKKNDIKKAKQLYEASFDSISRYNLDEQYKSYPSSELYKISLIEKDPKKALEYLNLYKKLIPLHKPQLQSHMQKDLYKGFIDAYLSLGNLDSVVKYQKKYVELMDSSINLDEFMSISSDFRQRSIDNKNKEIENLNLTILNQRIIFFSLLIVLILVISILALLIYFRYKIKDKNKILFKRNIEIIKAENEIGNKFDETIRNQQNESGDSQYSDILSKIYRVMEDASIYCNPEFNLSELTRLIQSNTKYVSQAINEGLGQNFRTFINEYRIRLARKRLLSDNEFSNMTISAIAESVGFKSVTSFNQAFQKYVGISPTSYRKMGMKI